MKVSVAMITHNQERFIAHAIESVLMQETDFDYELVIGEDCSTDHTRELVADFQKRFPEKIHLVSRDRNVGMMQNLIETLSACKGEYVAFLEGDDYWLSTNKLQKQVEFLDLHQECSMCFHPVKWFYEEGYQPFESEPADGSSWPAEFREFTTFKDVLDDVYIQFGSVMFRGGVVQDYPSWMHVLNGGDWPLFILHAESGTIGCLPEVMSAYRRHSGGVCQKRQDASIYTSAVTMYENINAHFGFKYRKIIRPRIADYSYRLALFYDQEPEPESAQHWIARAVKTKLLNCQLPTKSESLMFLRLSLPSVYFFSKRIKATVVRLV